MLVTFRTKAHANITMFGDVATELLKLLGHSGTIPSAIKAEDVPPALARLEAALAQRRAADAAVAAEVPKDDRGRDDYEAPRKVTLSQRAFPLLELLRAAAANKTDVLWDYEKRKRGQIYFRSKIDLSPFPIPFSGADT